MLTLLDQNQVSGLLDIPVREIPSLIESEILVPAARKSGSPLFDRESVLRLLRSMSARSSSPRTENTVLRPPEALRRNRSVSV